jgi:dihydroorotate dehydrogenase
MPDWSYRTVLRPLMLSLGAERARRLATATLATLARSPFGPAAIDFLGHMRAGDRLRTRVGAIELAGPMALGSMIDPSGKAVDAFARFGVGLIEVGPVVERGNGLVPEWRVDLEKRAIQASGEITVSVDEVAKNLETRKSDTPICVRIGTDDPASIARIIERLQPQAAMFRVGENLQGSVRGVWLSGDVDASRISSLRSTLGNEALIVAGGVTEPEDARRLLEAGANAAVIDAGLIVSGPGLVKRCNEALLSTLPVATEPEPLTMDAARRAWFWALLLGVSMFAGGLLAIVIASTRVVLPYDESLSGMTRAELSRLNPRLLAFMAHDRASLAGTMLSIGIFYSALAWCGIRRGSHWAQMTVIASATAGFLSFFFFLGFGYFDPFHAFVTAILTQFTLLCLVLPPSPPQASVPEWRESAAWRRGQWGQLLFILIGAGLTGAGLMIAAIGCTSVFVETDLEFMRATREQLHHSYETLVPLVAHDRASLGGMLIANGIAVWLSAQWGFRAGARWLWVALAWGGNIAFACATAVHVVVGYHSPLHLAPAMAGWVAWNVALLLTRGWLSRPTHGRPSTIGHGA